jgi:hypothetical protein
MQQGRRWTAIGADLGRLADSCRDRWKEIRWVGEGVNQACVPRNHKPFTDTQLPPVCCMHAYTHALIGLHRRLGDSKASGVWSTAEVEALQAAVQEYLDSRVAEEGQVRGHAPVDPDACLCALIRKLRCS